MVIFANDDPIAEQVVEALCTGQLDTLAELLTEHPHLAKAWIRDRSGVERSLLHVVTDWPGHFPRAAESISMLITAGAEANAALRGGNAPETPLHWAASSDDVEAIRALLDAGADCEAPGAIFTGGSPLSDAVIFAQWHAARLLVERGAATTLWQAAALGLLDRVRVAIECSPRPSSQDVTNALWNACRGGQLEVAQYLVAQGGDPHALGHDQKTSLDVARDAQASGVIEWLESLSSSTINSQR